MVVVGVVVVVVVVVVDIVIGLTREDWRKNRFILSGGSCRLVHWLLVRLLSS